MNTHVIRRGSIAVLVILFILSLAWFGLDNYRAGSPMGFVIINSFLLGVPLGLMFFSAWLIIETWLQRRSQGRVNSNTARLLYHIPRFSAVAIIIFIGLFALDVFEMEGSTWEKIGAFLVHAAPSLILALLLVFAWRYEWIGAAAFALAAIFFMRFVIGRGMFAFGNLLLFVLPLALISTLFWLNWRWKAEIKALR